MERVHVEGRVHQRHPELSDSDVEHAWSFYLCAATSVPGEREMRLGYDRSGRLLEMVGVLCVDGWHVYHAMTPPSKKTFKEVSAAMRRL